MTIIIFDLALHICIFIIDAEYFWLFMAGFKEKFYTLILKFVYITFCLQAELQTVLKLKILLVQNLFYCKASSELVHSVLSLLIVFQVLIDLIYFSPLKFFLGSCI